MPAPQADAERTVLAAAPHNPQAIQAAESNVAAEWKVGDVILDLYAVKQVHEGGGMGLVYRVHHRGWNMALAVKSPRPEFFQTEGQKANFVRECETWINLGLHPHVVSCHYVRTLGGVPRVFAEYVEGGTLKDWIASRKLDEGGPQEALKRILDIAIQTAWGLHYAHEHESKLIHQDVKPANVLMLPNGTAKITDFGLAKARAAVGETLVGDKQRSILVSSGGMTPVYCSPEQANQQPLTRKTDIWSWAVSVLEMFVGEVCWQSGVAAPEVLRQLKEVRAEAVGLPELPKNLWELLQACFETDTSQRPKSMEEIAGHLKEIYQQTTGEPYPRQESKPAELLADALNNRALSLLDLAKPEEALGVFEQALVVEPSHLECLYNRGLMLWRRGKLTDQALLAALGDATATTDKGVRGSYLMGLLHLERGDSEGAVKVLEAACAESELSLEGKTALQQARTLSRTSTRVRAFEGHIEWVTSVALSADCCWALPGSSDKTLRLWEVTDGPSSPWVLARPISSIEQIRQGSRYRASLQHGLECLARQEWEQAVATAREALACEGDSQAPEALDLLNRVSLRGTRRQLRTGFCRAVLCGHTSAVWSVALSTSGRLAVSREMDGLIRVWELTSSCCVRTFEQGSFVVRSLALSADGKWALSGSGYRNLCLLEVANGCLMHTFEGHTDWVSSVAFSIDGRWALSGSADKSLRLWEVASGRCVRTFEEHTDWVTSVALSPDGRWALSGSKDATVRLWRVDNGRCVRTFEGHTDAVTSLAISADGRCVVSGSEDRTLRVWELDWECEFPAAADWDEGARPYLEIFLTLHCALGADGFARIGKPEWTEDGFQKLVTEL